MQRRYRTLARELKRLESSSRSPLFQQFNQTLNGLETIRGMSKSNYYMRRTHTHSHTQNFLSVTDLFFLLFFNKLKIAYGMCDALSTIIEDKVNENTSPYLLRFMVSRWLSLRLEWIGGSILFCTSLVAILARHTITPGMCTSHLIRIELESREEEREERQRE